VQYHWEERCNSQPLNSSTLKFEGGQIHSELKRNLISFVQLTDVGMKTIFDGDLCKTWSVSWLQHMKKGRYSLHDVSSTTSISVVSSNVDVSTWHRWFGHMSEKGMKAMLSKGKLLGLKSIDLGFLWRLCLWEVQESQFLEGNKVPEGRKVGGGSHWCMR